MSNYNYGAMLLTTLAGRHGDTATVTEAELGRQLKEVQGQELGRELRQELKLVLRQELALVLSEGAAIKLPTHTTRQRTLVK